MVCRKCGNACTDDSELCERCATEPAPPGAKSEAANGRRKSRRQPVKALLEQSLPVENWAPLYEVCSALERATAGRLLRQPVERLAEDVATVVAIEGPVHVSEAVRRLCYLWGVKRAGQRIQQAIRQAIVAAERNGGIERRGGFLWPVGMIEPSARRRRSDFASRIQMICDEEIEAAARLVLAQRGVSGLDDIVIDCLRLFGIQARSGAAAMRIRSIVLRLVEEGQLEQASNGCLRPARQSQL